MESPVYGGVNTSDSLDNDNHNNYKSISSPFHELQINPSDDLTESLLTENSNVSPCNSPTRRTVKMHGKLVFE